MTKYGGYTGKILRVNLTNGKFAEDEVTDEFASKYVGGNGFGAKIIYDEVAPEVSPFDPDNLYVIMTGPAAGTLLPCSGRVNVHTISPLTGLFFDSSAGGSFGPELKYAGYDGVVISGRAAEPSYLWIKNQRAEIRRATHLWGLKTSTAQDTLAKEIGDSKAQIGVIGPAGEKLSRISSTIFGVNAAGRGGSGAVLGSKNLKAIAVRGTGSVRVASIENCLQYVDELSRLIKSNPGTGEILPKHGTLATTISNNKFGVLPTRNCQQETFDKAELLGGQYMIDNVLARHRACHACPIACSKYTYVRQGPYKGTFTKGPEYQTVYGLGTMCYNESMESVMLANKLCNDYGLDTISTGVTIAFAMECWERGILTEKDTGDLDLSWGNQEAIVTLVRMMGERKGIGDILADGTNVASQRIGKESAKFALQNKGCEIAGHSARGLKGLSVGYATGTRGGSHHDGRGSLERLGTVDRRVVKGKGEYMARINHMTTFTDSLIACHMLEGVFDPYDVDVLQVGYLNAVTGMDMTAEEGRVVGERIWNLERAINVRRGVNRSKDSLPNRYLLEPIPDGPSKGMYTSQSELDQMLDEYYEFRGWDKKSGIPTKKRLRELGLDDVAQQVGV